MNEGCYNCGREETYNGADNPDIRYLCAICTAFGLARQEGVIEEFERVEAELKKAKAPRLRISKKRQPKENKTLSTC